MAMDMDELKELFQEKFREMKSQSDRIENKMDEMIDRRHEDATKLTLVDHQTETNRVKIEEQRIKISEIALLRNDVDSLTRQCDEVKADTKKNTARLVLWTGGLSTLAFCIGIGITIGFKLVA
jgi:hypothetical protein